MLTIKLTITKLILSTTIHFSAPTMLPDYAVSAPLPTSDLSATISTDEIFARLDKAVAQ